MRKLLMFLTLALLTFNIGWAAEVTIAYSGSTTTNMTGNNDAATLGLSATDWSVVGAKGSSNNLPGLNKDGTIRLYTEKNSGDGNTITVTSLQNYTISSIKVDYKQGADYAVVSVGGSSVTGADGEYDINGTSFVIKNTCSGATTQVHINSIVITYSTGGGDDPVVITPPTFDPAAGEVVAGTEVTITGDEGTTITYTTDGTDPTESETALTVDGNEATVTVNETMTIKAVAMDADLNISEVATASYTIKVVPTGYIFYESFDGTEGTGGNDNLWSGQIANTTAVAYDNEGWTTENVYAANKCIKLGSGSKLGTAETPTITLTAGQAYTLTFKAAAWNANSEKTTLNLSATGATLSEESIELAKGAWTDYTVVVTATEAAANIKWEASNASSNRFFLDEVLLVEDSDTPPVVIVAPPTFSPAAGQVAYGTEVTISSEQGTTITYTSDGTDPTTSETALTVDGNEETILICDNITLKAFATNGTNVSSVATAAYTLIMPAAPTFSPAAGKVEAGTVVTITGAEGTTITYTTDGTDPVESSTALTAESNVATVTVNEAMTIKAVTMDENGLFSEVAEAHYTIQQSGGGDSEYVYYEPFTGTDGHTVSDSDNFNNQAGNGNNIVYVSSLGAWTNTGTFKGAGDAVKSGASGTKGTLTTPAIPVEAGKEYTLTFNAAPWNVETATMVVEASSGTISYNFQQMGTQQWNAHTATFTAASSSVNFTFSATKNRFFLDEVKLVLNAEQGGSDKVIVPAIQGTTPFYPSTEVTITCATEDASIYYTLDGEEPTSASTLYEGAFTLTQTTTVKAIAVKEGLENSNVATKEFVALPSVENIADFYEQQPSSTVAFANPVIAIGQSSDKKYTYAQDASSDKGLLIYNNASGGIGVAYTLGQEIPAGFQGKYSVYKNQPEFANATGFTAATTPAVEVTPLELTPDQITTENIFRYAVIKGATLTSDGKIVVGENSVIRFNRFDVNDPEDLTKTYDIYGVTGIFDENLQFMPIRFEEVVEETGVTLAEALAGENGDVKIISDMQVVVANNAYAIVSDGEGNWLKLTNASELEQGQVVTNVTGAISGLELNPVMTVTGFVESDNQVEVTTKQLNLGTIHRTALTELKPNEVADFVGYYNAQTSELCAFSSGSGLHIAMATDNMVGEIVAGKQQTITGVVELKAAWDAPAGAPARVAIDDDQAFENIRIDATAASVPTGVETVKAIDGKEIQGIYNVNGQQVKNAQNGVYIIRYTDGTAAKVRF